MITCCVKKIIMKIEEMQLTIDNLQKGQQTTRLQEKMKLKEIQQQQAGTFTKRLKKLFSGGRSRLPYKYYLSFMIIAQLNLELITTFIHWCLYYGGVNFFIGSCLIILIFELPLMLLYTFLGAYSKKTIISIWECMPIIKGTGLSILLLMTFENFINITVAAVSFRYIFHIFSSPLPWSNCQFKGASNICYPPGSNSSKNWECCGLGFEFRNQKCEPEAFDSTSDFFRYYMEKRIHKLVYNFGALNVEWAMVLLGLWIIIFFLTLLGLSKINKMISLLGMLSFVFTIPIYLLVTIQRHKIYTENRLIVQELPWFDKQFWRCITNLTVKSTRPGLLVYINANAPSDCNPLKVVVIITICKICCFAVILLGISIIIGSFLDDYNTEYKCLRPEGNYYTLVFMVHLISNISGYVVILFLWFMSITALGFCITLLNTFAVVDSVIDAIPTLSKKRPSIAFIYVLFSFMVNLLFVSSQSFSIYYKIRAFSLIHIEMFIFAVCLVALVFIYGAHRLKNDYFLAHKQPISNYWIVLWKLNAILSVASLFFLLGSTNDVDIPFVFIVNNITLTLIIAPMVLWLLWKYYVCLKYQDLSSLFKSGSNWIYYQFNLMNQSDKINPYKPKYQSPTLVCDHSCLMGSIQFKKELVRQDKMLQEFLDKHYF